MSAVQFDDDGEVLNGDLGLLQLLVGTAHDVVGPYVFLVNI